MQITDIARIKVNWMEQYGNDPHMTFILKRDKVLTPWDQFRWRQFGNLFVAEHEGEVNYISHDRNDHNGFGGRRLALHMADDWNVSGFRPCNRTETRWGSLGSTMEAVCAFDATTRILTMTGPWSGGATGVTRVYKPVMDVATLEGPRRNAVANPEWYHRQKNLGRAWDGTAISTAYTLEFVREAIDRLAPHLELYEGNYGWFPVVKGEKPKNQRKAIPASVGSSMLSDEQMQAVMA